VAALSVRAHATILVPLLAAAELLTASAGTAAEPRPLKPVHKVHDLEGLSCTDCHTGAETSKSGSDLLLPKMDACGECHDVKDDAQCVKCHTSADDLRGYMARPAMVQNFPHELHVKSGMQCATCHVQAGRDEPVLPDMASCRSCHATVSQQGDCRVCHAPGEPLLPTSHGAQFRQLHALQAAFDQKSCEVCHTQTDCQECHNGDNVRPRTHPLNYFYDHALDARSKEVTCASCHRSDFCIECHRAQRVLPQDHSRGDWLLAGGGRHAEAGRLDMESCAACHDNGSSAPICADCHGR
jgi:hypothetical protein